MAAKNFMKRSSKTDKDDEILKFPDGSGFKSKRLPIDPNLIFELSEEFLPVSNARRFSKENPPPKNSLPFKL